MNNLFSKQVKEEVNQNLKQLLGMFLLEAY